MQQKDQMHPEDIRNLILFGIISVMLWFAYDHFVLTPQQKALRASQVAATEKAVEFQAAQGLAPETERPREEIVAQSGRITMDNAQIMGSIRLMGARIDDLTLKNYYETVERDVPVSILSPTGTAYPKYMEYGWVSSDNDIALPDKDSVWQAVGNESLSMDRPVILEWENGQGITFRQEIALNDDYAFMINQSVINKTDKDVTLYPYGLIVRRGIPKEFLNRMIIHEGPMVYAGDEMTDATFGKMTKKPSVVKDGDKGWVALTTKDWFTAIVPTQGEQAKMRMTYTKGAREDIKDRYQVDVMGAAKIARAGETISYQFRSYAGAKKLSLIEQYEKKWNVPHFDLAVDFGMFYFLTRPFFMAINFFYGFVGNFGIAIILFTVCLRICVFPLANTSFKSFARMKQIAPQMAELREKYSDDKQKMQQELVKLYQKEKVNPMAGCLPILVQIPIFYSLFKVLSNTIEMRHAPFFGWIQDLSAKDPTSVFNLFGLIPWTPPEFLMIGAWPCLMLITMLFQRTLNPPPTDKMQAQMFALMPWVMTIVLAQFAAGLVIYWTFNNFFSTIQQYIIMRRMGVKVDIIGNILGKTKEGDQDPPQVEGIHPEAEVAAKNAMDAIDDVTGMDEEPPAAKEEEKREVSKPKPKRSKKKK